MSNKINSIETEEIRNRLLSRNLYTPENEYSISNSKITEAINSLASLLAPTNSFDFTNTIIGRQLQPQTPLVKIANSQLASQLQYQIASNAKRELIPIISFANLFDKNDNTKFIKLRKDYSITDNIYNSRALNFISEITGYQAPKNPFTYGNVYGEKTSTSQDLYNSLGSGQKDIIINLLNKNYYTPSIAGYSPNHSSIIKSKTRYFNISFSTSDNYPTIFGLTSTDTKSGDRLNQLNDSINQEQGELRKSLTTNPNEYINIPANNEDYYGKSNLNSKNISIDNVNGENGLNDFQGGVTSIGIVVPNSSNELHWGLNETDDRFNVKTGLLYYTKNLIQALGDNNNISQVKKQFKNSKGEIIGYNGSPANEVRQHTVADQYNRYGKLIRFIGNSQYDVNENSVINKTVFPKIHPIQTDEGINNRNLFFSIENLAYQINENGDVQGVSYQVDGKDKTLKLPTCERGQQGGRLMWFAPYDVQFNETSSANIDSIPIIGRGEMLHSYASTERTGVLSFKMIIDHPKQMNGLGYKELVNLFATGEGGVISTNIKDVDVLVQRKNELENELIKPRKKTLIVPSRPIDNAVIYYFDNNSTTIDSSDLGYEMFITQDGQINFDGSIYNGLNLTFDDDVDSLISLLRNSNESEFIKLEFVGYTSLLAGTTFNETLGLQRATALKDYIEFEYKSVTGKDFNTSNIEVILISKGETGGSTAGDSPTAINDLIVKKDRRAGVNIKYNEKTPEIDINLTADDERRNSVIQSQINAITKQINLLSDNCSMLLPNYNDFIPRGWEQNGIFKTAFHSQTPEDFHKRLTFLHQCTRQGVAVSNNVINSAFGRQPVAVLRLGDFIHSQIMIDSINFDFTDSMWDMNPEGMGMQYMIAAITMNIKILGGQSLGAPISRLQNALSFNYYANSTYYKTGSIYEMTNSIEQQELANIQSINNRNNNATQAAQSNNIATTPI